MNGDFGPYGGRYVAETLVPALRQLEAAFGAAWADPGFRSAYNGLLKTFVGRPTPITPVNRLTAEVDGARIYLKREDLAHTGAHKINNAVGQALLTTRLGKGKVVAETGAGQHGVATAAAAALFGLECTVFMGAEDVARQAPNVARMKLLGADVRPVHTGTRTLKDAVSEAIRYWLANVRDTHYLLGSAIGPHPYPTIVRTFQSVIGIEARAQMLELTGRLPDAVVACVGGGSNSIGIFSAFLDDPVELLGVEAAGDGLDTGRHAAPLVRGSVGVMHGTRTYLLQDPNGQILPAHSIAAGLDYSAVGPEHAFLKDTGRTRYIAVTNREALNGFHRLCRTEGIIPALESAHAVAAAFDLARRLGPGRAVLVNLSGRGDKDIDTVTQAGEGGQL